MKLILKNNKNYLGLEKSVLERLLQVLMQTFFGRQALWPTQACLLVIL